MPDNAISITTIKATTFVMTLFNSTYIRIFLLQIEEIAHIDKILRFRSRINKNNNYNNNRLPLKLSRWLANPGGTRFSKPIEGILQEELNACLYVSTHLRGLQLQKFIYEIRTSGHNVCFLRSAPHNKTSVNVHSNYASRCKLGV